MTHPGPAPGRTRAAAPRLPERHRLRRRGGRGGSSIPAARSSCVAAAASARGGRRTARAPARAASLRAARGRQVGIEKRELPPRVNEQRLLAKARLRARGAQTGEVVDERPVLLADADEIPGCRRPARAGSPIVPNSATNERRLGGGLVADRRAQLGLALDVRRQPDAAAERSEAGPRQAGAQLVADGAAVARGRGGSRPATAHPSPKAGRTSRSARRRCGAARGGSVQRHARAPPAALAVSQPSRVLRDSA